MSKPKIVLPEGDDERVCLAARTLIEENYNVHPILIGDVDEITSKLAEYKGSFTCLPPDSSFQVELKISIEAKGKKFSVEDHTLVHGACLVRDGEADGIVAGAVATTSDVFRTYVKTIGLQEGVSRATSCFLMERGAERYIFADCGLNPLSTATELAETANLCAIFAKTLSIKPRIAFLGFQTVDNAEHPVLLPIVEAVKVSRETYGLTAAGPLQFDAALSPKVAKIKTLESTVAGKANVYIFPDLNSGNIAYKITERLGGFKATGPLFLGFGKPAHDLSRGCSIADIVRAVEIAAKQSNL